MNSKTITFWGILIAGVIAVSAASWFIGNAVAGHVIQNRKNQKDSAAAQSSEKSGKNGMDQRAESLSITDMDESDPVEVIDDSDPAATDTADTQPQETDSPAAPETIPSADAVSGGQPAGNTAADNATDELFGDNGAAPAEDTQKQPPVEAGTTPDTPAPAAKILYRVQIGAFSNRDNAVTYAAEAAEKTGLNASPIKDTAANLYRVQCGAFSSKDSADKLMRELELQGYKVHMSEVKIAE